MFRLTDIGPVREEINKKTGLEGRGMTLRMATGACASIPAPYESGAGEAPAIPVDRCLPAGQAGVVCAGR